MLEIGGMLLVQGKCNRLSTLVAKARIQCPLATIKRWVEAYVNDSVLVKTLDSEACHGASASS